MHESSITEALSRQLHTDLSGAPWKDLRESRRQKYYRIVERMTAEYHRLLRAGLKVPA